MLPRIPIGDLPLITTAALAGPGVRVVAYDPAEADAEDRDKAALVSDLQAPVAQPYASLTSPDGGVWHVTVDNAGALHATRQP